MSEIQENGTQIVFANEAAQHLLPSYGKIYSLGHRYLADLLKGVVLVEEKVDGSQFSFGKRGNEVRFRSSGATIYPETAQKLFKAAVEYVLSIKDLLHDGWTYRGEVLHAPRHNTLTYNRVPKHNIVLFDIETDTGQNFLTAEQKRDEATRLDLEVVPVFCRGIIETLDQLKGMLETESFLGGCKIEGIVLKNYDRFGEDGKALMGKWVREEFKEIHRGAWKAANPSKSDLIEAMVKVYRSEARWEKAVQHLRDAGLLQSAPQDIGPLMKEFQKDLMEECSAEIKEKLFEFAFPRIARGAAGGLPEWYKERLAKSQFEQKETQNNEPS